MKKIYIDSNFRCHTTNPDGIFREVETVFFDGKCDYFVSGYCYDDSKGYPAIYPWKPHFELDAAQAQYERMMAEAEAAYREGVNSVD